MSHVASGRGERSGMGSPEVWLRGVPRQRSLRPILLETSKRAPGNGFQAVWGLLLIFLIFLNIFWKDDVWGKRSSQLPLRTPPLCLDRTGGYWQHPSKMEPIGGTWATPPPNPSILKLAFPVGGACWWVSGTPKTILYFSATLQPRFSIDTFSLETFSFIFSQLLFLWLFKMKFTTLWSFPPHPPKDVLLLEG